MSGQWWRRSRRRDRPPEDGSPDDVPDDLPADVPDDDAPEVLRRRADELRRLADELEERAGARRRADLDVRVLGGLTANLSSGLPAEWRGTQARTLFGYLVVRGRPVHRDVLMELLWPGLRPASARGNLNVTVYALRRALGGGSPGAVLYRDGWYGLNPEVEWAVDRDRFVRLAGRAARDAASGRTADALTAGHRAAGEYAGQLLAGEPGCDWCETERVRLHDTLLQLLETVADLSLGLGDVDGAVRALDRAHTEDPCRESVHRALMACYARRGQRDLVVRQFKRCVRLLDEELDVRPSPQTTELFDRLTAG